MCWCFAFQVPCILKNLESWPTALRECWDYWNPEKYSIFDQVPLKQYWKYGWVNHVDSLAQDCSNSIANALDLLQSCTKPSKRKSPSNGNIHSARPGRHNLVHILSDIHNCDEPAYLMITSSNGNIFRVTGPLCGEFTGPRPSPRTKASDAEHWYFLWSAAWINGSANNGELVIWDAIALVMTSLKCTTKLNINPRMH